jgi:hypothetical protein
MAERSQHVMGLYGRSELVAASRRTLEAIRQDIPSDTTRARFDRIFRPHGDWLVDLHDAALGWARTRMAAIEWKSAKSALAAAHWIDPKDRVDNLEALPRALYGLSVLAATDSAAFDSARARLWRGDSTSAMAAMILLTGYRESQRWYGEALGFFLTEPWIPDGHGRSIGDYVRDSWRLGQPSQDLPTLVPDIQTRWFGYPQAVPHYGVPPALFGRLVKAENPAAADWLQRHGESDLLRVLRRLPVGATSHTLLRAGSETLRLTTVARQSRESLNGFLEPHDAIAIDPGYSPLLALGAIVHEWQHLLFRRHQLQAFAERLHPQAVPIVQLPGIQPYLAEGFAEWSAEQILAPVIERWPLLGLGELEKRAGLARSGVDDQHATGYALVRALAAALADPAATTHLLLRHSEHPSVIMAEPLLRRAWRKHRRAPDRVWPAPGHRVLTPEVTFTVEDGFPDIISTRILVPIPGNGER